MTGNLEKLFELSLDLICIAGTDGYFKKINPAFSKLLGYSEKELLGTPFLNFIHPDDRESTMHEVATQLKGSPTLYFENRYLHKDGSVRWLAWNATADAGEGLLYAIARDVTGQKNTETALRQSEALFRTLVETANDAILLMDLDFNRLYENDEAWKSLGYTRQEWGAAGPIWELMHPGDVAAVKETAAHLMKTGSAESRYRIRHKDGHYVTRFAKSKIVYADGKPASVIAILRDISEMEHATEALRHSELLMNTANAMARIGGWEYNLKNQTVLWTDEVYRIHGLERGSIPPGSIIHIAKSVACFNPGDRPVFLAAFQKCVEQGVPFDMELPFTSAAGRRMWIRTAGNPLHAGGKDGGITGAVGHIMDITERKEAENTLKAIVEGTSAVVGERFFRSLVRHFARALDMRFALIAEMDDEHTARTIAFWADGRFAPNFSYDIRETPCAYTVGKKFAAYPGNVASLFPKDLWLKENGVESYLGISLFSSAGKYLGHLVIMDTRPMTDTGRPVEIMKVFAARAAAELERREAEAQLKAAKEKAEAATLLKDKFVSLVAHDFRSPLATINMMLNLAQTNLKAGRGPESSEILEKVHSMCDMMMMLAVNLLDASKLQSGDFHLVRRIVSVKTVCDDVIEELGYSARKKEVALVNHVPPEARWYIDKTLFQRVLHNLVTNAVKFSRKGGTVTVAVAPGNPMHLTVRDTGVGIHESIMPDLFKYDVKTSTAGTEGERGTGFGLPMGMDIIRAHGGTIRVSSRPGEGSLFTIEMPDAKPEVLVVEDDEVSASLLGIFLERLGAAVLTAQDGGQALEIAERRNPALIISDIVMPGTDGMTLLHCLKNSPSLCRIPVVIVTGKGDAASRQTAFDGRADDFIAKPLSESDFMPRIGRFLAG